MKDERRAGDFLKALFIVIGAVVSIAALIAVAYTLFRKYFQVTFECGADDTEDDTFAEDEDKDFEPICCCEEDEEAEDDGEEPEAAE